MTGNCPSWLVHNPVRRGGLRQRASDQREDTACG